ncbi:MAG TPA: outer membrane beta-barrel protein [Bacteroidia bacterium]
MKKTLLLAAASLFIAKASLAQVDKNVRFGIRATPAINFMTPDNDKKVQKNGAVMKAGLGLVLEFKITDVASFQTGLEYTAAGFKAKYMGSDTAGYLYKDDAIVEATIKGDSINSPNPYYGNGYSSMRLLDRKYNIGYLNVPLTFKLKTKDIGGMTYFGQIGGNLMVKLSTRSTDNVEKSTVNTTTMVTTKSTEKIEKLDIGKTMNLLTACASIGGGAEYNISGSTSLYASLHYQHHFMNATKADSGYLLRSKVENGTYKVNEFQNAVKLRQIVLAVGVLF